MRKKHFNWKLAIVLLIALMVLAISAVSLRKWQKSRTGSKVLEAGLAAYENHDWPQAAKNLGSYLMITPDDTDILFKYADTHLNIRPMKLDNIKQIERAYRNILRLDKNNKTAAEELISIYLKMDIPAEAELIAERYLRTNKDPKIRVMLAMSLSQQRKFSQAAIHLKNIIEESPEQVLAYETLGRIVEHSPESFSQHPEYWFSQAVNNNSSSAIAYISRASFYLRARDNKKAMADLTQAETLNLSDFETRLRLVRELIKANMFDKAKGHLINIKPQNPDIEQFWELSAMLALKTMSKKDMLKTAQEGLKELSSQPWDFMPTAVELFIRAAQLDIAEDYIKKLSEKTISPMRVAFLKGLLAEAKKQYQKTIYHYQQARQSGDSSEKTSLSLAKTYYLAGDTQSAILQLRSLISEKPYSFTGHLELAKLLRKTNSLAEAVEHVRLAMQLDPENTNAPLFYAQTQIRLIELNQPTGKQEQIWNDIENLIAELENITGTTVQVKLMQCRLAIQRQQFPDAEEILKSLKADGALPIEVAINEIDLFIAQDKTDQAISMLYALTEQFDNNILPFQYLAVLLNQQACEKLLSKAINESQDPLAKRNLTLLMVHYYDKWNQRDKSCEILTKLLKELIDDIPLRRQLLKYKQVIAEPEKAQLIIDQIKLIEGEDGWQWKYEQAKLLLEEKDFENHFPRIITLLKEILTANPRQQTSRMLLAAAYDKSGELQLALSTYREVLNSAPADITVIIPVAKALYNAGEYEEANEILTQAAVRNLSHPELSKLILKSHLRQGNFSSAESTLKEFMAENPQDKTLTLIFALTKMRQGKFSQADTILHELKAQHPNSLPITAALVELNIHQNKSKQALSLCDEMVKQLKNAAAYIMRGKTYVVLAQLDQAKKDFEQAIILEPDNIQAWLLKSELNLSMARHDKAISDIQHALKLDPENMQIQKLAISLLLSSKNPERIHQGRKLLSKALALNQKDIKLRLYKASLLLTEKTATALKEARFILQELTEEQPQNVTAWSMLAKSYLNHAQPGKAMDVILRGLTFLHYDKTLLLLKAKAEAATSPGLAIPTLAMLHESDPNDIEIVLQLADEYITANETDKAVNILKKQLDNCDPLISQHNPSCIPAMNTLAALMQNNGQITESIDLYKQILDIEPNDIFAINNLAWILCEEQGEYIQALELTQRGLKKAPEYADLIDTRGVIYYRLGQNDRAVNDFNKCIELYPADSSLLSSLYFHRARALIALEQNNRALENLQKALALNSKAETLSTMEINEAKKLLTKLLP